MSFISSIRQTETGLQKENSMKRDSMQDIDKRTCDNISHALRLGQKNVLPLFKERPSNCHKGNFGYVTLIGGSINYSGAAKLANMSLCALRSGCGVSRLACPKSLAKSVLPYLLESTFYPLSEKEGYQAYDPNELDEIIKNSKAIAIGMGWGKGEDNEKILGYLIEHSDIPLVIDADGLNTLAKCGVSLLNKAQSKVILTPHTGEAARLSSSDSKIISDPAGFCERFAREHNVIFLLKGPSTIVTDGKDTYIVDRGCPGMASAGSGDVLTGAILGMLGYNEPTALTVASAAYLCGVAGEIAQQKHTDISMIASDTVSALPEAIIKIRNQTVEDKF